MKSVSGKKIRKIILIAITIIIAAIILFLGIVFICHTVQSSQEEEKLKDGGYYNPVSVGNYKLNVSKFGNENGKHTIVGMAGLGVGDFSVTARQMTSCLEEDNLLVFIDRAGYGFSDDTDKEMTIERIVEDYRMALKNSGIKGPYILMPHSIGGVYATYWVSKYPEEIEAVAIVDGSELCEGAFESDDDEYHAPRFEDHFMALLAKMGFSRMVLRNYEYLLPENYSDDEQYLADALALRTLDSIAPVSESGLAPENARKAWQGIVKNDVPKIYISASWGIDNWDTMTEYYEWVNKQIERNNMDTPLFRADISEDEKKAILDTFEKSRQEILFPYLERMGNCKYIPLGGDHMIYQQKPTECGKTIKDFIDGLK